MVGKTSRNRGAAGASLDDTQLDVPSVLAFIGLAANTAWIMLLYASGRYMPVGELGLYTTLCVMVGAALCFLFCGLAPDVVRKHRGAFIFVGVLLSLPLSVTEIAFHDAGFVIYAVTSVLAGIGYGFSFALWSEVLCVLIPKRDMEMTAIILLAGVAIAWPISQMIGVSAYITAMALPIAAGILLVVLWRLRPVILTTMDVTKEESDSRQHVTPSPAVSTCASSTVFGMVLTFVVSGSQRFEPFSWLPVVAALVSCVIIVYDAYHKRWINEDFVIKIFLPTAIIMLIPALVRITWVDLLCEFIVIIGLIMQMNSGLSALSGHVRLYKLSAIRAFGVGRFAAASGFALGWGISTVFLKPEAQMSTPQQTMVVVVSVLLVALILVSTFVMRNHYPDAVEAQSELAPGTDDRGEQEEHYRGQWQQRCDQLANECGLSSRQREVLWMLAKGRDAGYIEEALQISNHTVKAHIYNIYQKTGVHSRQELFERIEDMELDETTGAR